MPKPKPRIRRLADGWHVIRPGYGFTAAADAGPYHSHQAAVASLESKVASAHCSAERTTTPATARYREHIWPLEFR